MRLPPHGRAHALALPHPLAEGPRADNDDLESWLEAAAAGAVPSLAQLAAVFDRAAEMSRRQRRYLGLQGGIAPSGGEGPLVDADRIDRRRRLWRGAATAGALTRAGGILEGLEKKYRGDAGLTSSSGATARALAAKRLMFAALEAWAGGPSPAAWQRYARYYFAYAKNATMVAAEAVDALGETARFLASLNTRRDDTGVPAAGDGDSTGEELASEALELALFLALNLPDALPFSRGSEAHLPDEVRQSIWAALCAQPAAWRLDRQEQMDAAGQALRRSAARRDDQNPDEPDALETTVPLQPMRLDHTVFELDAFAGLRDAVEGFVAAVTQGVGGSHLLLHGPPGSGKTALARATAKQICRQRTDVIACELSLHTCEGSYHRESGARFGRYLHETVMEAAGGGRAIVFLDEIEAFIGHSADLFAPSLTLLTVFVDAVATLPNLHVIGATNHPGAIAAHARQLFTHVEVPALDRERTVRVLDHLLSPRLLLEPTRTQLTDAASGLDIRRMMAAASDFEAEVLRRGGAADADPISVSNAELLELFRRRRPPVP